MSTENPLSFAFGDTVTLDGIGPKVITDFSIGDNSIEYAVDGCAWYSGDRIKLVSRATDESMKLAFAIIEAENDEDAYDGSDDADDSIFCDDGEHGDSDE